MVYYKKDGSYQTNLKCVCGLESCRSIVKEYRAIKDARGELQRLPNSLGGSLKSDVAKLNEHYMKRLKLHAPMVRDAIGCQTNLKVTRTTRQTKSTKREVYIALWHFDNRILSHLGNNFITVPKTFTKEIAMTLGIYNLSPGQGILYTQADLIECSIRFRQQPTSNVALIPTVFNTSAALEELELAKEQYRLQVDITSASQSAGARSSLNKRKSVSSTLSTGVAVNGSKRPRSAGTSPKNSRSLENPKRSDELLKMSKANMVKYIQQYARHAKEIVKERDDQMSVQLGDFLSLEGTLRDALAREDKLTSSNASLLKQIKEIKENNANLKEQLTALKDVGGLKRSFLSSKRGIGNFPNICKQLYGFGDYDFMIDFLESMFEIKHYENHNNEKATGGKGNSLTKIEQCLLTLVYTNTLWGYDVLGMMFGLETAVPVGRYIRKWLPLFGERGDMLSRLLRFMGSEEYDKLEPPSYDEVGLKKVAALIDGKDFLTETVRSDRFLNCSQASNKMHASAFRVLTWSLPCGIVIERTCTFLGRASEKSLMKTWGKHGRLKFPIGYLILGDKGFDNTAGCYTNYNTTLHPSFLTHDEFNKDQVNHNIFVCQKRYSCEVVYSRITQVAKLSGVFRREWFQHFESLVGWAHGRANLCYGFLQDIDNDI